MVLNPFTAAAMASVPLLAAALVPFLGVAANRSMQDAALVGSWSLVSRITTDRAGAVVSDAGLSAMPSGLLIYDGSGHVAAQLSRPDRTEAMLGSECEQARKVKGTPDTAQTIMGYDAYFGTYTVDVSRGVVTHHLDSALFPGDIGKSIERRFTLSGDTLTIRFETTQADGKAVMRTLVWRRLKAFGDLSAIQSEADSTTSWSSGVAMAPPQWL